MALLLWHQRPQGQRRRGGGEKIAPAIRERIPQVRIVVRAEGGFAGEEIFCGCGDNGVFYVAGMPKNAALQRQQDAMMLIAVSCRQSLSAGAWRCRPRPLACLWRDWERYRLAVQ